MKQTRLWKLKSRRWGHIKTTNLWLYPELDCSSCVDDVYDESGEEQLQYYVQYIQRRYPQWWDDDAVPIYWSVRGDGDAFGSEAAPCMTKHENVLTYYYPPRDAKTDEVINWFQLPVRNTRFPAFAKALGWLPAPFQMFAPLRSIVNRLWPK